MNEALAPQTFSEFKQEVLKDYAMVVLSREVSILGRKEVLTGKAKFGIFGDGKEVAQVAMAKFFKEGDFRSGYYRDQTFMFASGMCTVEQFFAQLYADSDIKNEPSSSGRQMNAHFSTPFIDEKGNWLDLVNRKNSSSDIAPTAAQVPRALGLAYASKIFRTIPDASRYSHLTNNGNEVCFCTIGDSSTSQGQFWETINATGVLQVPLAIFVWDDGYGISVPKSYQTTKNSISEILKGFEKERNSNGIRIHKLKGWDYAALCQTMETAIREVRNNHITTLFHIEELTQPLGHSTSGSHERYKSRDRLDWETKWDCVSKMKEWMLINYIATDAELTELEEHHRAEAKQARDLAWKNYTTPLIALKKEVTEVLDQLPTKTEVVKNEILLFKKSNEILLRTAQKTLSNILLNYATTPPDSIVQLHKKIKETGSLTYNTHLYNETAHSTLHVPEIKPQFSADSKWVNGYEIINLYFDHLFASNPLVYAFGEDVGLIGDVNQGFNGLQKKYGEHRIFDTGIRELTIIGQAIGMALRGLRPIAEIQYLDYLLYALQPLCDDVCTTHYRTRGQQSCPLLIRTRGHRLEGIWHSGSPMGIIVNALRGMHVCVPRNMTQAVGMYNTLLNANDPAIVIECLNGYRLKEQLPENLETFTVPLGICEIVKQGTDMTIVTYGSTLRIVLEACNDLEGLGIHCEVIDVQTLLPFDITHIISTSVKKTNRIIFIDEDVPYGCTAYMLAQVIEKQAAYKWLDTPPKTLTAKPHRTPYGSDGDYFTKPNVEDVIEIVVETMKS